MKNEMNLYKVRKCFGTESQSMGIGLALLMVFSLASSGFAQSAEVNVELVLALDVVDRQPVGENTVFAPDTPTVVAWTRVTGAADTVLEHVWRYRDHEFVVPLEIGAAHWRTWSRKTIPAGWHGEWTLEVRNADGAILASRELVVGEAQAIGAADGGSF